MSNELKTISKRETVALLGVVLVSMIISVIEPYEMGTWFLEVVPVLIGIPILFFTFKRFPLTPLTYRLLTIHALILILGGHYSYARVPLGFWIQDLFDFSRNHYDRIGHLAQGFIPAILAREILLRTSPLKPGKWLFVIVMSIVLAFSAFYEMIEWWAAIAGGDSAESFLGTQGDIWDTQWDMFIALLGAITAQLVLSKKHDKELNRIR
ncbi:MAG: DUF2238 domain-containing protein [Candidatus Marinimicrobia bacterium]|nr:DUF2238 domain-containing protein [Candidatus Neomarinimicrobiota bacterium]